MWTGIDAPAVHHGDAKPTTSSHMEIRAKDTLIRAVYSTEDIHSLI